MLPAPVPRAGSDLPKPLEFLLEPIQKSQPLQRVKVPILQLSLDGLDPLEPEHGFKSIGTSRFIGTPLLGSRALGGDPLPPTLPRP